MTPVGVARCAISVTQGGPLREWFDVLVHVQRATPAALDQVLSGVRSFDEAMADDQSTRHEQVLPIYEFTTQLATLAPHRPTSSSSWPQLTATSTRWTASPGSTPG